MSCGYIQDFNDTVAPGMPSFKKWPPSCQHGGMRKKTKRISKKRRTKPNLAKNNNKNKNNSKNNSLNMSKLSKKQRIDLVIDKVCKQMKKRCTPKFKKILRKLVIKNLKK